jgi:hypothetical protein
MRNWTGFVNLEAKTGLPSTVCGRKKGTVRYIVQIIYENLLDKLNVYGS